jgi:lanosterol synthase
MPDPLDRGVDHLIAEQREEGCWEGEMVWCTMILSQYVIVRSAAGGSFDDRTREQIIQHYRVTRTPEGAWGMHPDSGGYVFFTTLAYIALRLMRVGPDDPLTATAREWLRAQEGGVLAIPSWGKFWLALVDLYDFRGVNPTPPEIFILPEWLPFHPRRYYCHTRLIYLAMAYLYGSRCRAPLGRITADLRRELYGEPYDAIDFTAHRHTLAPTDVYVKPSAWLRWTYDALRLYEAAAATPVLRRVRRRALERCVDRIVAEQRATQYQAISPVNGLLNCLALWSRNPEDPDTRRSLEGMEKWKWEDDAGGIRFAGARSNAWDTAFSMLALLEFPALGPKTAEPLRNAYRFLKRVQMTEEIPGYREQARDPALGGWCFSNGEHRWPVSDCTAEALTAVLKAHQAPELALSATERISSERIHQAVEFILSRQNADGGFGTYERRRASSWLEKVNPSEMFGQCMTERSYIECTGSSLAALSHFRAAPSHTRAALSHTRDERSALSASLRQRVDDAIRKATAFLRRQQRPDGSFPGFWGINFTYAIFHVVKGLRAAGVPPGDPALRQAADWLTSKQKADGGWGEHYSGCLEDRYVEHSESQVVMTSWALLALMQVLDAKEETIRRGIAWLASRQQADGSWPQQGTNGVFFGAAMLDYRLYKSYFPVWALARYAASALG